MRSPMTRREMIRGVTGAALGGALAAGGARASAQGRPSDRPPNIIFILADDLGYGDLGCYGQQVIQTPCLDRMAAEGMRFTNAYAGSTVCAPSRCCLMTGLHTGHARVRGNARVPLRPEDVTVAEVLEGAGYATGIVGKWGLGEPDTTGVPNRKGFDEWFGYLNQGHAHNYYPDYLWRNETPLPLEGNRNGARTQYSHDLFTAEAQDFVRHHAEHPFFLYLAYTIPHANNELGAQTGDGMEVPDYGDYADRDWPNPEKGHAAMISRMDGDVGALLYLLSELEIHGDTVVFFSSDNGPHKEGGADPEFFHSSGPLRGLKRDLYDGGIRVPLLARWPGVVPGGSQYDHPCAFWDFLPTAADLAGASGPDGLDGVSFGPALRGLPAWQHNYLYWEFYERGFQQAVRVGDHKGLRLDLGAPIEVYDLAKDIGESTNIAAESPRVVQRIEAIMSEAHVDSAEFPIQG